MGTSVSPCPEAALLEHQARGRDADEHIVGPPPPARGLHSFRFQLNFSSSVHRVTQLNPEP
jgi:hypothetical protein